MDPRNQTTLTKRPIRRLEYWPDSELPDIMNFLPQTNQQHPADDMYARGFGSFLGGGPGPRDPSSGTDAGPSSMDHNLVLGTAAHRQRMEDMGDPSQGHYFDESQGVCEHPSRSMHA